MMKDFDYLAMARTEAQRSPDPSTKTGAVLVKNGAVIGIGHNRLPAGINYNSRALLDREWKYPRIVHCERVALIDAYEMGHQVRGATLYTWPFMSCAQCAALMAEAGIARVVAPFSSNPRWAADFEIAAEIFERAKIELHFIGSTDDPEIWRGPKYIALCGNPHAGKSEVQRIMAEDFGVTPVDDGWFLREAAKLGYNLTDDDVSTQAGKDREIVVCGHTITVRQLLGRIGNALEREFGEHFVPETAMLHFCEGVGPFSLGSVRKTQGWAYRRAEGSAVVIEVIRPGCGPSGNDFDIWDDNAVTHVVVNDGSLEDLRDKVRSVMAEINTPPVTAFGDPIESSVVIETFGEPSAGVEPDAKAA